MNKKWNFEEKEKSKVSIWVESIIGGIAMAVLFWAVMILSAAVPQ